MKMTEIAIPVRDYDRIFMSSSQSRRSKGIHLSGIIKGILLLDDPERYGSPIDDNARAMFELGFRWENTLKPTYPEDVIRQFEMKKNRIIGTCDALFPRHWRIGESKATWISAKHDILSPRLKHWIWQGCGYCAMADATEIQYDVLYVNGYYDRTERPRPIYRRWLLEFKRREVRENWEMLLNNQELAVPEVGTDWLIKAA